MLFIIDHKKEVFNLPDNPAAKIADLIHESKNVCVLTGAGISTESGIPDFRSPGSGLWTKHDPMALLSTEVMFNNPKLFYTESIKILESMARAKANKAHEKLAEFEERGLVHSLITQNIDGLHFAAGSKNIYEVHGHLRTARCLNCNGETSFNAFLAKSKSGEIPPRCDKCGGILRTNVVLFGDSLPECFDRAYYEAQRCDLMIVIGSSLAVAPVNMLPRLAEKLAIINIGKTEYSGRAESIYNEKASIALESISQFL